MRDVTATTWTCQCGLTRALVRVDGKIRHDGDYFCESCGDWVCGYCELVHGEDQPGCPLLTIAVGAAP